MRATLLPLALVACLGVALAVVLFPSEEERALMYLKDKEFSEALDVYEKMVQKGKLKAGPVKALSELYVQYGDINKAIDILEQFVRENPGNIEAMARLGTYYQYAQRPGDYQTNLEKLAELDPTKERLVELAEIYNFVGDYKKQIAVLRKLIAMPDPDADFFVDAATLLVGEDKVGEAIDVLADLKTRYPKKVSADTLQFMLNLLLSNSREDDALAWAKAWFDAFPLPKVALDVAELFTKKGQPRKALELLEKMEPLAKDDVTFQVTLLQYQYNNGKTADVFAKLKKMSERTKLPAEAFPIFVELSLNAKDLSNLITEAKRQDVTALENDLLIRMVKQISESGDKEFIDFVINRYEQRILDSKPIFVAELYYAANRMDDTNKWVEVALLRKNFSIEDNIRFSDLLGRLNKRDLALEKLKLAEKELHEHPRPLSAQEYILLAKNYINLSIVPDGEKIFAELSDATSSYALEQGQVLIFAAAKRFDDVTDWLDEQKNFDAFHLEDLHRILIKVGEYKLGLTTAKILAEKFPGPLQLILLGRAQLHNDMNKEAEASVKEFIFGYPEAEGVYFIALTRQKNEAGLAAFKKEQEQREAAGGGARREAFVEVLMEFKEYQAAFPYLSDLANRVGKQWVHAYIEAGTKIGAQKEISEFLIAYLNRKDIAEEQKKEFVYALIEIGGPEVAFPHIKKLAYEFDPEWGYLYVDLLKQKKNVEELKSFLKEWGLRSETPNEVRKFAAYELLQTGLKKDAEMIYMDLAKKAEPKSDEVKELLYIWGAKREPYRLKWLLERTNEANKTKNFKAMGQWLSYVNGYADPNETLKYLESLKKSPFDIHMKVVKSYLKALFHTKKFNVLDAEIIRAVSLEGDTDDLMEIAELAESMSTQSANDAGIDRFVKASETAYRRVLAKEPENKDALRRLGMLAFNHSRLSEAEQILRTYTAKFGEDDYEAHYFIGECLFFSERKPEAEIFYAKTLKKLKKDRDNPVAKQIVANIKDRYGFKDEAIQVLEEMRLDKPADDALQADYALILIEDRNNEMMTRHMLDMH